MFQSIRCPECGTLGPVLCKCRPDPPELAALRAEVERLREELLKIKFAVAVYDDSSDRWRSDFDASCAGGTLADAVRAVCDEFLPAPPAKEE